MLIERNCEFLKNVPIVEDGIWLMVVAAVVSVLAVVLVEAIGSDVVSFDNVVVAFVADDVAVAEQLYNSVIQHDSY